MDELLQVVAGEGGAGQPSHRVWQALVVTRLLAVRGATRANSSTQT